jgi:hypothetical protein
MIETYQRNYNLTDADLIAFALDLVNAMTRDATQFATRSVLTADITALGVKANEFLLFPNDAFYEAQVMQAAENKNQHRENIQVMIRDIIGYASVKWGPRSTQVYSFKAGNLTKDSDNVFMAIASQAVDTMEFLLPDLTASGLTQQMIDDYETEVEAFRADMSNINIKTLQREVKSHERADLGNELYALVSKYCEIGKILFDDVDPVKYSDYLIYTIPPGVPGKIDNMMYESQTSKISWGTEPTATEYQLEFSPVTPQFTWLEVYRGPMTFFVHVLGPGQTVYRVRGINSNGNGYWSDNLLVSRI